MNFIFSSQETSLFQTPILKLSRSWSEHIIDIYNAPVPQVENSWGQPQLSLGWIGLIIECLWKVNKLFGHDKNGITLALIHNVICLAQTYIVNYFGKLIKRLKFVVYGYYKTLVITNTRVISYLVIEPNYLHAGKCH